MSHNSNRWFAFAIAAACIVSLASERASASLQLSVNTGSGFLVKSTQPSGGVAFWSGSQNNVTFSFLAGQSNSPGSSPQSVLNITSLLITNTNPFDVTVQVLVGDTDFAFPSVGPVGLASGIGGSVTSRTVKSISYQTWIDDTNSQNGMSGITSGLLSQDTTGIGNGGAIGPLSNVVSGTIGSSPYSMTGLVTIVLGGGGSANFSSSAVAFVPEASTIAVWSVLSLVGAGVAYRQRMATA